MLRSYCLVISTAVVVLAGTARADFAAFQCDGPSKGPVKAIVDDGACVGYQATNTVTFPFRGSGRLLASADGRTVVMLESYLNGTVKNGRIVEFIGTTERPNPIAVHIFRDGKLVAVHRIHDLVVRANLIVPSISHVRWVRAVGEIGATEFSITTSSFRTIRFDSKTGSILENKDAAEWNRCDVIAAGQLDLPNNQLLKPFSFKAGKRIAPITFERAPGVALTNKASATVCLVKRGQNLVLAETL